MNNTIEFVLRMRDMMSSNIAKASSNSSSAFNKMKRNADQAKTRNKVLGMSFNELQTKIKRVEDTIRKSTIPSQISAARRELSKLQRLSTRHKGNVSGGSGGGIGIGGVAGGAVLANVALQGVSMIGRGIGTMIQGAMNKETSINGMSTFLGKKGATEAYGNIEKDAEATPFDTASLLQVNRSLISAGTNAKDARKDSMNLANAIVAVGGSNDTLTRMAANMQQIKTVGKATAMDIKQFGMAGINIYGLLSKSTGKSIDEVKAMDVTYAQLSETLKMAADKGGLYFGALENAQNSMQGKWSNVQERMVNTLTKIGVAFAPVIGGVLELAEGILGLGTYIIQFANWLTGASASADLFLIVVGTLGSAFLAYQTIMAGVAIKTGIVTAAQWLLNTALTANPIGIVVVAIAALIAGLVIAYKRFDGFRALVDGLWSSLKQVGSNIMGLFSKIPDMIIKSFMQIPKAIKNVFSGVGDLFNAIFGDGDLSDVPGILKNIGGDILKANPVTGFASQIITEATNGAGDAFTRAKKKSLLDSKLEKASQSAKEKKSALSTNSDIVSENEASGKSAGVAVSSAGPKTVNIHVGKFFDNLQFTTLNTNETANEIEKIVMECFSRVVYNGSKIA